VVNPILVRHAAGECPVHVAPGVLASLPALVTARHPRRHVVVISDAQVAAAIPSPLGDMPRLTFPAGERHKTRETWAHLTDELLTLGADRDTLIVAIGGGVTTDLAGFVAATFLRGVPWIAVPTTTLGMIDAAIGGKTGVDTPAGKNLVGAFHQPDAVVVDPTVLSTLPDLIYREGLAEAVKHGLIRDAEHVAWLAAHAEAIAARDPATLAELLRTSIAIKAEVVAADEREGGLRAILNAGHTVAHAIEQASDYEIPHGEAVAMGLLLETRVAEATGIAEAGTAQVIHHVLHELHLPTNPPRTIARDRLRAALRTDKKNRAGVVRAALLARIGAVAQRDGAWTLPLDLAALDAALEAH
jgi:3-dehydroquinate synthase